MYDIIFTQRKSIKNFNRSLTILGGGGRGWEGVGGRGRAWEDSPRSPEGGQAGKRW